MPFYLWSKTAASNANADPTINFAEGQAPSSLNDSCRTVMKGNADWRDDISGALASTGTTNNYVITSNQVFDTLAHMNGAMIAFVPNATNTGSCSINVDSLGSKSVRSAPGIELPGGVLVAGTPYVVTYNNSDGVFYLQNFYVLPYMIPIGGIIPYVGSTAPNSNFVFPSGQALSRTTYSSLFALTSTTFGTGDGSTTFNVPDLRNLAIFGLGNMGGSDRGLITNAVSGITGTTIGAAGGAQSVTVAQANLPSATLTTTITDPGHSHTMSTAIYKDGVSAGVNLSDIVITANAAGNPVTVASATTGITASTALGGSGTALNKMPPAMVLPYILRVI